MDPLQAQGETSPRAAERLESAPPEVLTPAIPRRDVWVAYAYLSAIGFVLYALGALTPYLQRDLGVTAAQAALHPSALAVGLMVAGVAGDRLERRLGRRNAGLVAGGTIALGGIAIAVGTNLPVTIAGAALLGLGSGNVLAATNLVLSRGGGVGATQRLARGNAWSLLVSIQAPLLIAAMAASSLGWRAVPILAVAFPVLLEVVGGLPAVEGAHVPVPTRDPRQPVRFAPGFWAAWLFVVAAVSIEFGYVVWGSTMVRVRTGEPLDEATVVATLFLVGMLVARLALGFGVVGIARTRWWIEVALAATAAGTVGLLLTGSVAGGALGLLVAGLGTGTLYPQGMAIAFGRAGDALLAAGARLSLASGVAILAVPLALGALADAVGVVAGWPLLLVLCLAALVFRRLSDR